PFGRCGRLVVTHGWSALCIYPRSASSPGARVSAGGPLTERLPGGVRDHARSRIRRGGHAMGAKLVRSGATLSRLSERFESLLVERGRVRARANARSCGTG